MCNSLSSFEIEVAAESCLFVITEPMLCVVANQILSKGDKIFFSKSLSPLQVYYFSDKTHLCYHYQQKWTLCPNNSDST